MKLIDKDALVAGIERWIELLTNEKNQEGVSLIDKLSLGGRIAELQEVKVFIDTLEVKYLQEEPVSEGRDIFDNCLKGEEKFILPQKISGNINCENCLYSSACALGDIQACIIDKPVSEELEEAADKYAEESYPDEPSSGQFGTGDYDLYVDMSVQREVAKEDFKAGAKWQKLKTKKEVIDNAVEWIVIENKNGGCVYDGWEEDFRKELEKN